MKGPSDRGTAIVIFHVYRETSHCVLWNSAYANSKVSSRGCHRLMGVIVFFGRIVLWKLKQKFSADKREMKHWCLQRYVSLGFPDENFPCPICVLPKATASHTKQGVYWLQDFGLQCLDADLIQLQVNNKYLLDNQFVQFSLKHEGCCR